MAQEPLLVGNGAGFTTDYTDAGIPVVEALVRSGKPAVMFYEMLAERTLAIAQRERVANPEGGYAPHMIDALEPVLKTCVDNGIAVLGNFGSANPMGAARRIHRLAREQGIRGLRIAVVEGDDVRDKLQRIQMSAWEEEDAPDLAALKVISANVYLGGREVASALALEPHVVVTGRVTDSALALGPLIHHFGWREDDWDHLAAGTVVGHLLECGAQVTGGYFADPGWKDVPDLDRVGFPIAECHADGSIVVTKPEGTGGLVSRRTVIEQLLYEIHDPAAYLVPDVTLDMTEIEVAEIGPDRVRVTGAKGHKRPPTLKTTICFDGGWLGEGEISYAGPNAFGRARLAKETVERRIAALGLDCRVRVDLMGFVSIHDGDGGALYAARDGSACNDLRVRLAVDGPDERTVERATRELEGLYCAGPAGGGGVRRRQTWRVRTASCLIPRESVDPKFRLVTADDV
jgi:hypothetical protein